MARQKRFNYPRLILQWGILSLLAYMVVRLFTDKTYIPDFESYCPYGGMQALSSFLVNNSLACSMTSTQIFMGIGLIIGIIIFSKLFCGYICPIGTVTEWLGSLGRKMKIQLSPRGPLDRGLRVFKYVLLFITFYFTIESSELFCKKFDPYYAAFTGFSSDVDMLYGILALVITFIGSIFIRQAWCKYFCPFGAISNLFTYFPVFIIIFGIYYILILTGISLSWVVPMATVITISFLIEIIRLKDGIIIPLFRITRNDDSCTNCKLCDKACPQGITVSTGPVKVNHVDCNMCGDCITVCPHKNTLLINKKNLKWLPVIFIVILIASGIYFGKTTELPTVNERWGTEEQFKNAKIVVKSGLKSIKCFGSSAGFVSQMHEVKGVIGAATFVGTHTIKVYYDPSLTNERAILESIYSPIKYIFQSPNTAMTQLSVVTVHINKFFDTFDAANLETLLAQQKGIYGLETMYGEPVVAKIYFNLKQISAKDIKAVISSKELIYDNEGVKVTQALEFEVVSGNEPIENISRKDFLRKMFSPYSDDFNGYNKYKKEQLSVFEIAIPQIEEPEIANWIPYLESHLSKDSGIVAIETDYKNEVPVGRIFFVSQITDSSKICKLIMCDSLSVKYESGERGNVKNPFIFSTNGRIIKNKKISE